MDNIVTVENLIKADYKPYSDVLHRSKPEYQGSYQKRVTDKDGTKYFINIDTFDLRHIMRQDTISFSSSTQFNNEDLEVFDIEYHVYQNTTVEQMENFFEKAWQSLSQIHYEMD